jgi:hypothetical protein
MKGVFLAAILTLVIGSACNKGTEPDYPKLAYFPNDVGNWWGYDVYDSLTQTQRFVTVSIHRDTILSSGKYATIWRYYDSDSIKIEKIVVTSGDSVKFYLISAPDTLESLFIIPFSVGRFWGYPNPNSGLGYFQVIVAAKMKLEVPLGRFDNSYIIASFLNTPCQSCFDERTYWFAPYTGFLQFDYNSGANSPNEVNETWRLTDIRRPMP